MRRKYRSPLRVLPENRFPALSEFPGHRPAQLAACAELGNCVMSVPNSAIQTRAVVFVDPGYRAQPLDQFPVRLRIGFGLPVQFGQFGIERVQLPSNCVSTQRKWASVRPSSQNQFRHLVSQLSDGLIRHALGIRAARGEHLQHRSATLAHDVGGDRTQLDVHRLQQPSDAIDRAIAVVLDMHAHPRQLPQLPDRLGRNEAAAQ